MHAYICQVINRQAQDSVEAIAAAAFNVATFRDEASKAAAAPSVRGRQVAKRKVIAVAKLKARPARTEAHAHT